MPQQLELRAERRTTVTKGLRALRQAGYVPANLYGPAMESIPLQVELKAFQGIARRARPTTMINLTIEPEAQARSVYLQHVQWQFIRHEPFHLDFYAVDMTRHMRSAIQLVFHGESPAARSAEVMVIQPVSQVHVEALPKDMPQSIDVDLSVLTEVDQTIHARDLKLPNGVTLLSDPDELIARVQLARGAVEEAKEETAVAPVEAPTTAESS
jgi:large subunit ribosomal protein L25